MNRLHGRTASVVCFFTAEHDPFALFGLLFPKISQSAKFVDIETLPKRN